MYREVTGSFSTVVVSASLILFPFQYHSTRVAGLFTVTHDMFDGRTTPPEKTISSTSMIAVGNNYGYG